MTATHSASSILKETQTNFTLTNANTREKLPEASPKGPGPTHFRALAGQRSKHTERTLVLQGLASRSTHLEIKNPNQKTKLQIHKNLKPNP